MVGAGEAPPVPGYTTNLKVIPWRDALSQAGHVRAHHCIDGDMAAILYTSGSTGKPKGVVLSHRNLMAGAVSVGGVSQESPRRPNLVGIAAELRLWPQSAHNGVSCRCHRCLDELSASPGYYWLGGGRRISPAWPRCRRYGSSWRSWIGRTIHRCVTSRIPAVRCLVPHWSCCAAVSPVLLYFLCMGLRRRSVQRFSPRTR